jgi:hypothetical protein
MSWFTKKPKPPQWRVISKPLTHSDGLIWTLQELSYYGHYWLDDCTCDKAVADIWIANIKNYGTPYKVET